MNLFFIESTPVGCARSYVDRHVTKIFIEATQMLSTVARRYGVVDDALYAASFEAHPMTIWVGDSSAHFMWTLEHAVALYNEYLRRYGRTDTYLPTRRALSCVGAAREDIVRKMTTHDWSAPPQCMPEQFQAADYRTAYRRYYAVGKAHLHAWRKPATKPEWIEPMQYRYGPSEAASLRVLSARASHIL